MIGIVAIEIVGGVYCPLSPTDPPNRVQQLIQDTSSRTVIAHSKTKRKIAQVGIFHIDHFICSGQSSGTLSDKNGWSIKLTAKSVAYILFTSGSTGTPKAVIVFRKNARCSLTFSLYLYIFCRHSFVMGTL